MADSGGETQTEAEIMRFLPLILCMFLLLRHTAPGAEFEYGTRPVEMILDVPHILKPAEIDRISETLKTTRDTDHIDVVVVILPSLEKTPPPVVAANFAKAWCSPVAHAIVLHVPGEKDSPWIFPGGDLISAAKPGIVEERIARILRHSRAERSPAEKLRVAATETTDLLRFLFHGLDNRSRLLEIQRKAGYARAVRENQIGKIRKFALLAAIPALLIGGLLLYHFLSRRSEKGLRTFSSSLPPRRLGAPHCGGNHIVRQIGKFFDPTRKL